jgi:hypothetical protein
LTLLQYSGLPKTLWPLLKKLVNLQYFFLIFHIFSLNPKDPHLSFVLVLILAKPNAYDAFLTFLTGMNNLLDIFKMQKRTVCMGGNCLCITFYSDKIS